MICEFYSIKETATIFGVNEVTIRRAIKKGLIIAIKIGDGKRSPYRISKKSIENIHLSIAVKHAEIANRRIAIKPPLS